MKIMTTDEKILKRINQIQQRIYDLNDKIDNTISSSEIRKIDKIKSKLYKEKVKLMNKLYQQDSQETLDDETPI